MFTFNRISLEGFTPVLRLAGAWRRGIAGVLLAARRARVVASLDSRIQYDVGLNDRRPLPSRSPGKLAYPASVEAMLNRRY